MGLFSWLGKMFGGGSKPPSSSSTGPFRQDRPLAGRQQSSPPIPTSAPTSGGRPQKPARKLNLDPGQFAPLTSDQVRRRARFQVGSLFSNPWFGRRDLIPPVSDERTALIDRGMVGLGLLTPEQLVEIH